MLQELGGKYEGGQDPTIEAQRKSVLLKQSEEMSFYFMSILAIVLVVTTPLILEDLFKYIYIFIIINI